MTIVLELPSQRVQADINFTKVHIMSNQQQHDYQGWRIDIQPCQQFCASYSFAITSPAGRRQEVPLGGENAGRALERAREMIDLEMALEADQA